MPLLWVSFATLHTLVTKNTIVSLKLIVKNCKMNLTLYLPQYLLCTCSMQVKFIDLSLPQYWLSERYYDWLVCLEVIEHIPRHFEQTVLDNLARAARRGAVISWAHLRQNGFHHVNNRRDEYVVSALANRGLYRNDELSKRLRNSATLWWLKQNLYVYRRGRPN
jgi:hypothetical protein